MTVASSAGPQKNRVCPDCGQCYEPEIERCADCGADLPEPVTVRENWLAEAARGQISDVLTLIALAAVASRSLVVLGILIGAHWVFSLRGTAPPPFAPDPVLPAAAVALIFGLRWLLSRRSGKPHPKLRWPERLVIGAFLMLIGVEVVLGIAALTRTALT
jgi:hypothetical protein